MQLFNIAAAEGEIKQLSTVDHAHTDHVRELATQEGQSGLVASGGQYTSRILHRFRVFSVLLFLIKS